MAQLGFSRICRKIHLDLGRLAAISTRGRCSLHPALLAAWRMASHGEANGHYGFLSRVLLNGQVLLPCDLFMNSLIDTQEKSLILVDTMVGYKVIIA